MYWINQIRFGTPTVEQLETLNKQTYLDALFAELTQFGYPNNSSDATKEELNQVVDYLKELKADSDWMKRYVMYDRAMIRYFKEALSDEEETRARISALVDSVIADSSPLLLKLKYHFNRPRPRQLADAHKLKLFPYNSISDNTPSFPSGHAFQAKLLFEVIGNTFPSSYPSMEKLFQDICYSRVFMGLNYQSDVDVAIFCADKCIEENEFKIKYRL